MPIRSLAFILFSSLACAGFDRADAPETIKPTPALASVREIKPRFQFTPFHLAEFAALSGAVSDVSSSWGCAESNPLLRGADGRFGTRGFAIKAGMTGGTVLVAHLLHRKHSKLDKPLGIILGVTGGFLHATAIRNRAVGCY